MPRIIRPVLIGLLSLCGCSIGRSPTSPQPTPVVETGVEPVRHPSEHAETPGARDAWAVAGLEADAPKLRGMRPAEASETVDKWLQAALRTLGFELRAKSTSTSQIEPADPAAGPPQETVVIKYEGGGATELVMGKDGKLHTERRGPDVRLDVRVQCGDVANRIGVPTGGAVAVLASTCSIVLVATDPTEATPDIDRSRQLLEQALAHPMP
jgi:hypothetical protein